MKTFLVLIFTCGSLFGNDLDLLHTAILEGASTPKEKEIVQRYLDKIEAKKAILAAAIEERSRVASGGKMVYARLQKDFLLETSREIKK